MNEVALKEAESPFQADTFDTTWIGNPIIDIPLSVLSNCVEGVYEISVRPPNSLSIDARIKGIVRVRIYVDLVPVSDTTISAIPSPSISAMRLPPLLPPSIGATGIAHESFRVHPVPLLR